MHSSKSKINNIYKLATKLEFYNKLYNQMLQ
jgi:hypothetical protein